MRGVFFLCLWLCVVSATEIRGPEGITVHTEREFDLSRLFGEHAGTPGTILQANRMNEKQTSAYFLPVGFSVTKNGHAFVRGAKSQVRETYYYVFNEADQLLNRWTVDRYDGHLYGHKSYSALFEHMAYDTRNDLLVVAYSGGHNVALVPFDDEGNLKQRLALSFDASANPVDTNSELRVVEGKYAIFETTDTPAEIVVLKYTYTAPSTVTWSQVESEATAFSILEAGGIISTYYEYATTPTRRQLFVFAKNDTSSEYSITFGDFTIATGAADYSNEYSSANLEGLQTLMARQDEDVTGTLYLLAVTDTKVLSLTAGASSITAHDTLTWEPYANAQGGDTALTKCKGGVYVNGTDEPAVVVCQYTSGGVIVRLDVNTSQAFVTDAIHYTDVRFTKVVTADVDGNFVFAFATDCGTNSANVAVPCIVSLPMIDVPDETDREFGWREGLIWVNLLMSALVFGWKAAILFAQYIINAANKAYVVLDQADDETENGVELTSSGTTKGEKKAVDVGQLVNDAFTFVVNTAVMGAFIAVAVAYA